MSEGILERVKLLWGYPQLFTDKLYSGCSRPVSRVLSGSIIYLVAPSLTRSYDLPPGIGRAALSAGIHGLSTHGVYGFPCCHGNR